MGQGTQSQCTGTNLREGMGRDMGGGFRMGDTYTHGGFISVYGKTHCNIVISLQLKLKKKKQLSQYM